MINLIYINNQVDKTIKQIKDHLDERETEEFITRIVKSRIERSEEAMARVNCHDKGTYRTLLCTKLKETVGLPVGLITRIENALQLESPIAPTRVPSPARPQLTPQAQINECAEYLALLDEPFVDHDKIFKLQFLARKYTEELKRDSNKKQLKQSIILIVEFIEFKMLCLTLEPKEICIPFSQFKEKLKQVSEHELLPQVKQAITSRLPQLIKPNRPNTIVKPHLSNEQTTIMFNKFATLIDFRSNREVDGKLLSLKIECENALRDYSMEPNDQNTLRIIIREIDKKNG